MFSVDTKERLKVGALFIFQSYKVIMGSMLSLFVPQLCENEEVCTISDNLLHHDNDVFHQVTLGFNFLSVLLFIGVYVIELKRENWCVKYLDIDHNIPDNNLETIIKDKPDLLLPLSKHNTLYFKSIFITSIIYSINLALSSILIYDNYAGIPSVTSYMSYVVLILLKIYNSLFISYDSMKNNKALSAYIIEFTSYNKIDVDHAHKYEIEDNHSEEDTSTDGEKIELVKPVVNLKDVIKDEDIKIDV